MSYTIQTASGTSFFTNVNSEILLGKLCFLAGAKYADSMFKDIPDAYKLAFSMTEQEANDAADKLLALIPKAESIFSDVIYFFEKGSDADTLVSFIKDYAKDFKDSKGYETL